MDKNTMIGLRLEGRTYKYIAGEAGLSRQRIQQIISPPAAIRDFVVNKYEGYCGDCGLYVGDSGHVHHNGANGEEHYNDIENLQLLCISCHRLKHTQKHNCKYCDRGGLRGARRYCNDKCRKDYYLTTLTCSYCGKSFVVGKFAAYIRTKRSQSGAIYCSHKCQGKWFAETHGFIAHPEHRISDGRKRKWDYEKVYKARDDTGFGATKLNRLLGIPISAINYILRSEIERLK